MEQHQNIIEKLEEQISQKRKEIRKRPVDQCEICKRHLCTFHKFIIHFEWCHSRPEEKKNFPFLSKTLSVCSEHYGEIFQKLLNI